MALPRWGVRLRLPALWRGVSKLIYAFRERYEPELSWLDCLLSRGQTAVDVGAHYGIYTLPAAAVVGPAGRVLAFEPAAEAFAILEENVRRNHLRNVRTYRLALSASEGSGRLYHHPDSSRDSFAPEFAAAQAFEEIRMTTLDEMCRREGVDRVDFIKMDVEGAEELVLRGAAGLLQRAHPVIILEANPEAAARLRLSGGGACEYLQGLGYRLYVVGASGGLLRMMRLPDCGNVVALWGRAT